MKSAVRIAPTAAAKRHLSLCGRAHNGYWRQIFSADSIIEEPNEEVKNVVKIRLRRMGRKKAPFYRIVVADARAPRDGRVIEEIGTYDPTKDPSEFKVNEELAKKWLANGAKPTEVVEKIFKLAGIEK